MWKVVECGSSSSNNDAEVFGIAYRENLWQIECHLPIFIQPSPVSVKNLWLSIKILYFGWEPGAAEVLSSYENKPGLLVQWWNGK